MIKRIIYFVESPFRQFDYEHYGIERLLQNGFEVEVWDFTKFLFPHIIQFSQDDLLENNKIIRFTSLARALIAIDNLTQEDFIIFHIGFQPKHINIYRQVSKTKTYYLVTKLSNIPNDTSHKKIAYFKKISRTLLHPRNVLNFIYSKIPFKFWGIRGADFVIVAGTNSKSNCYPIDKNTEVILAHTYEYDLYLNNQVSQNMFNMENYCVFIDENLPFHVDFMYEGNVAPVQPDEYFVKLEKFFKDIETTYNLEVIIAAHPRTNISIYKKHFNERLISKGRTMELIKHSSIVLAHYSTAILFAVLFNKKIIFITMSSFPETEVNSYIIRYANELGEIPLNLDKDYKKNLNKKLSINSEKYISYIEHYVKQKDTPQKLSTQILADRLKQIK